MSPYVSMLTVKPNPAPVVTLAGGCVAIASLSTTPTAPETVGVAACWPSSVNQRLPSGPVVIP